MRLTSNLLLFLLASIVACQQPEDPTSQWPLDEDIQAALANAITYELEDKQIPALSIAIVEGQQVLWAEGFGYEDPEAEVPATAQTTYRIGSVSKLFTDIAIMQLVEAGQLDLDTPVTTYLPAFQPENPYEIPITLRQLMSHRSGLVREPPVGNYFDHTGPSLQETVESLNNTRSMVPPESKIKYSNAGIGTVGYVLEVIKGEPFADYLDAAVLDPLGMEESAFLPTPVVLRNLAKAKMWTYDGRIWDAPTFELGMAPAGSMYSTVEDLTLFIMTLLNGGITPSGDTMLRTESLEAMWEPQYAEADATSGYGLGFRIDAFEGHRRLGHGGAIYGFSTQLSVLPEKNLGVVVATSMDVTNTTARHLVDFALALLLARETDEPVRPYLKTTPVPDSLRRSLAGVHRHDANRVYEITDDDRELYMWVGGAKRRIRMRSPDTLMFDGRLSRGSTMYVNESGLLNINGRDYFMVDALPPEAPRAWRPYIGEYGWDHSVLYILERQQQLHALIEWIELDPLTEVGPDTFNFPNAGMYHDEQLIFRRDANGMITGVEAAGIFFPRRLNDIHDGTTFTIEPVKPMDELRADALAAEPPVDGSKRPMDLVELSDLHEDIRYDIRYATTNNFMQSIFYKSAHAYMQQPAAEALLVALEKLRAQGYGVLIYDAYRPWFVTKMFWDATPAEFKHFVADPEQGSRHNRGCAVDLTLYDLETGEVVEMVGGYDEFTPRSYPAYPGGTAKQRHLRQVLRKAMESSGFSVYQWEWWHFDFKDWREYPIGNLTFEELSIE